MTDQQPTSDNEISGGTATTVVQAATTGPIHHHAPVINGNGATVISGDNHAPISQTFNK
ncbi:hypothetical protein ACFRCX_30440 [Streptomyces sp. NPDC056652]|uniref:hypothetical protein n=1 Tax=Streptomyces sp. NPDC056652 TaxID=3345893 RepID=UPI003677D2A6